MERKILIVDDDAHVRLLLEQTFEEFEDEGVELLMSTNGEEALNMIRTEKPQLVILDVMMPKMNGFDVCNVVKNELGLDNVYIVILTAKGQEFDKMKGHEVGVNTYMTKPFDPDELIELAEKILEI